MALENSGSKCSRILRVTIAPHCTQMGPPMVGLVSRCSHSRSGMSIRRPLDLAGSVERSRIPCLVFFILFANWCQDSTDSITTDFFRYHGLFS